MKLERAYEEGIKEGEEKNLARLEANGSVLMNDVHVDLAVSSLGRVLDLLLGLEDRGVGVEVLVDGDAASVLRALLRDEADELVQLLDIGEAPEAENQEAITREEEERESRKEKEKESEDKEEEDSELGVVGGRESLLPRADPELEEVDGLLHARVVLAVGDALAGRSELDEAARDDLLVAKRVLVLEGAAGDVGEDLVVAMRVGAKALAFLRRW